jgi:uncharacterized membrane protein
LSILAIFISIEPNLCFSLVSIESKELEFRDYKPFIFFSIVVSLSLSDLSAEFPLVFKDYKPFIFFSIVVSLSLSDLSAELPVIEFLEGKLIAI